MNKYLHITHNGKRKKILNGWLILRDEMEIPENDLQRYIDLNVPSLAVLNIVKKARKGHRPAGLALHLLAELSGNHASAPVKVADNAEKAPHSRDSYKEPHND